MTIFFFFLGGWGGGGGAVWGIITEAILYQSKQRSKPVLFGSKSNRNPGKRLIVSQYAQLHVEFVTEIIIYIHFY